MGHIQGGKVTDTHTTISQTATEVVAFLKDLDEVTKIAIGFLTNSAGSNGGTRAVKIVDLETCVLAKITHNSSNQQIWIYTSGANRQAAKIALARFVRDSGWQLRFGKTASG